MILYIKTIRNPLKTYSTEYKFNIKNQLYLYIVAMNIMKFRKPFINASSRIKYLEINVTKVQGL